MLIGVNGKVRSGKDTIAKYLVEKYGFRQEAFAAPLKEAALALDPFILIPASLPEKMSESSKMLLIYALTESPSVMRLSELVTLIGWEDAKEIPDVRRTLQRMGTEVGRNLIGETIWVDMALWPYGRSNRSDVVFSDVRFDNEAEGILLKGGMVLRVVRDIQRDEEADNHPSEKGISDKAVSKTIENNGTLEDLYREIDAIMGLLGRSKNG